MLSLIRTVLLSAPPPRLDAEEAGALLTLAESQQMLPLVYEGLARAAEAYPDPALDALSLGVLPRVCALVRQSAVQMAVADRVMAALEAAGVEHMPLKGAVLKTLYPLPEWRLMGDVDILIRPAEYPRVTAVMEALGCVAGVESDHEYHWRTPEGVHIELHKRLIPSYDPELAGYFGNGFSLASPVAGCAHRFALSPTDTYLYLVAHLAKHYRDGGVGAKYAVDLWIYRRRVPLDKPALARGLDALGLCVFHGHLERMLAVWLDGAAGDAVTDRLTERFLSDGVYGSPERAVLADGLRAVGTGSTPRGVRWRRGVRLLLPPRETLALRYPALRDGGFLPAYWVRRWGDALRHRRGGGKIAALRELDDRAVAEYSAELEAVGLHHV